MLHQSDGLQVHPVVPGDIGDEFLIGHNGGGLKAIDVLFSLGVHRPRCDGQFKPDDALVDTAGAGIAQLYAIPGVLAANAGVQAALVTAVFELAVGIHAVRPHLKRGNRLQSLKGRASLISGVLSCNGLLQSILDIPLVDLPCLEHGISLGLSAHQIAHRGADGYALLILGILSAGLGIVVGGRFSVDAQPVLLADLMDHACWTGLSVGEHLSVIRVHRGLIVVTFLNMIVSFIIFEHNLD